MSGSRDLDWPSTRRSLRPVPLFTFEHSRCFSEILFQKVSLELRAAVGKDEPSRERGSGVLPVRTCAPGQRVLVPRQSVLILRA